MWAVRTSRKAVTAACMAVTAIQALARELDERSAGPVGEVSDLRAVTTDLEHIAVLLPTVFDRLAACAEGCTSRGAKFGEMAGALALAVDDADHLAGTLWQAAITIPEPGIGPDETMPPALAGRRPQVDDGRWSGGEPASVRAAYDSRVRRLTAGDPDPPPPGVDTGGSGW